MIHRIRKPVEKVIDLFDKSTITINLNNNLMYDNSIFNFNDIDDNIMC